MSPKIVRDGWIAARERDALVLTHPERGEVVLLGVAATLFDLADGTRPVAELAALTGSVPEDIFAALDELADHGLLAARVAPPAAPRARSRREVLGALAGAAAVTASMSVGVASAAGELQDPGAREKQKKHLAPGPAAEEDTKMLAARQPHEQVYKESSAKTEQNRKLLSVKSSEQDEKLAPLVAKEESKKAEAGLLGAYEEAARRADSPAENEAKKEVELPAELAAMDESRRKQEVAPLRAEEEAAKIAALAQGRQLLAGKSFEQATKLGAREQEAKLLGEFGEARQQAHRALVTAQERRRKQASEQDEKHVRGAQERRWKADALDARQDEQHHKAALYAREQHVKVGKPEQQEKLTQAEEQREKHLQKRLEQYQQRLTEQKHKREVQLDSARLNKQAERTHKQQATEEAAKRDIVGVELRAEENAAKAAGPTDK